jgi:hypothetical protein
MMLTAYEVRPSKRPELLPVLPDEYYTAIREMASRWSWLENQLCVLIREILQLDKKQGRILDGGGGVTPMAAIIRALCRGWIADAELRREVDQFAEDILALKKCRDGFVEGVYGPAPGQALIIHLWTFGAQAKELNPSPIRCRSRLCVRTTPF